MQEICQSGSEGGAKLTFVPTPILALALAHARQHSESRRTFPTPSLVPLLRRTRRGAIVPRQRNDGGQVRNALPAQNAPHYQPLLPKKISQSSRGYETS
jgi:hypothetical protein